MEGAQRDRHTAYYLFVQNSDHHLRSPNVRECILSQGAVIDKIRPTSTAIPRASTISLSFCLASNFLSLHFQTFATLSETLLFLSLFINLLNAFLDGKFRTFFLVQELGLVVTRV
jgi:hypothetical protein